MRKLTINTPPPPVPLFPKLSLLKYSNTNKLKQAPSIIPNIPKEYFRTLKNNFKLDQSEEIACYIINTPRFADSIFIFIDTVLSIKQNRH